MKKLLVFVFVCLLFISLMGCASAPTSTTEPVQTTLPTTAAPTSPATTAGVSRVNEKGAFDNDHYTIGLRALHAIDSYLTGNAKIEALNQTLKSCYNEIAAFPEDDPVFPGNDFVRSYVFLAYIDFDFQGTDFPTKKYTDRNLLAAAIGEPEKEYAAAATAAVDAFLDEVIETMQKTSPDSSFSYRWADGNLFFVYNIPTFDKYYENKATLSAQDRADVLTASHGYVAGDMAAQIYDMIRTLGGDDFGVYFALEGKYGSYCVSYNLKIIIDSINE